jgi:YVTN family beta-propeller protein
MKRLAALLAVCAVALLLTGCGDKSKGGVVRTEGDIDATAFRGQLIDVPKRPIAIAAGEGGVWVTSMAGGVLTELDPQTLKKTKKKPLSLDDAPYSIDVAFGKVWVATFQNDKLIQVDPKTRTIIKTTKVDNRPFGMTHGFGSMWVTSIRNESLARINPATGKRSASRIPLSGPPYDVATGFGFVWVTDIRDGLVDKIDPKTNKVVDTLKVGDMPAGIVAAGKYLWVANVKGETNVGPGTGTPGQAKNHIPQGSVWKIDPQTGRRVGEPIVVPIRPQAIAGDDQDIWVASVDADTLLHINTVTGQRDKLPINVGNAPTDVAIGFGRVWTSLSRDDQVASLNPRAR